MSIHQLALLGGLFVMPALLLWLGHGFRSLSLPWKWGFWGGVIGQVAAVLLTAVFLMVPAVVWQNGSLRAAAAHWTLLLGGLGGIAAGYAAGRGERHRRSSNTRDVPRPDAAGGPPRTGGHSLDA